MFAVFEGLIWYTKIKKFIEIDSEYSGDIQGIVFTISFLAGSYSLKTQTEKRKKLWTESKPNRGVDVGGEKIKGNSAISDLCFIAEWICVHMSLPHGQYRFRNTMEVLVFRSDLNRR